MTNQASPCDNRRILILAPEAIQGWRYKLHELLHTFNKVTTMRYHLVSHQQKYTFELFKHNPQN